MGKARKMGTAVCGFNLRTERDGFRSQVEGLDLEKRGGTPGVEGGVGCGHTTL